MDNYILFFYGTPYADTSAVWSRKLHSRHRDARELEKGIKHGTYGTVSDVVQGLRRLPPDELNYIAACLCTWGYERLYLEAVAGRVLPAQIHIAQETGDYEFGDYYYTGSWSPQSWRRHCLEDRIEKLQREASALQQELSQLTVNTPDSMEPPSPFPAQDDAKTECTR